MNGGYKSALQAAIEERENRGGWFRTPPAPESARDRRSTEMIALINRVLAREEEREKRRMECLFKFKHSCRKAA